LSARAKGRRNAPSWRAAGKAPDAGAQLKAGRDGGYRISLVAAALSQLGAELQYNC